MSQEDRIDPPSQFLGVIDTVISKSRLEEFVILLSLSLLRFRTTEPYVQS